MLVVETIAKIRRAYFVQGKSIKAIRRELRVSHKVVRKVLRPEATEFHYEREEQPFPRIGRWKESLDRLLTENAAKASRERLTLIRLFEQLRALGYEGGYDAVRRYARGWQRDHAVAARDAFVPLSFAPGEAYQFDWSHEVVVIAGATVTVKVAQVRLRHSRMLFVRAHPRESQEMVFDAHDRAFAFFKGACTRGIYDNMKTAAETVFVGRERAHNRRFLQMCSHYLRVPMKSAACSNRSQPSIPIEASRGFRRSLPGVTERTTGGVNGVRWRRLRQACCSWRPGACVTIRLSAPGDGRCAQAGRVWRRRWWDCRCARASSRPGVGW
jgi:transposase